MLRFAIAAFLASLILVAIGAAAPKLRPPSMQPTVTRTPQAVSPATIRRVSNPAQAGTNLSATPLLQ